MLVDFSYNNKSGLVASYINKYGECKMLQFRKYKPTKYIECDESDPDKVEGLTTWDGKPVAQIDVKYANRYSVLYHMDESDETISLENGTVIKKKSDLVFEHNMPQIYYMDIETEIVDGFPDQHSARTRVLANSWAYNKDGQDMGQILGLKPLSDTSIKKIERSVNKYFEKFNANFKINYKQCRNETELLYDTFKAMAKMPVLTGWNFIEYDWVYLVNRANKIFKLDDGQIVDNYIASLMESTELVPEWNSKTQSNSGVKLPSHKLIIDYMDLFAKYDTKIKIKETNKLDFVAEKILGLKKISYEGSLQDLYENDYEKYLFYNIVDVILVKYLHVSCKYMDIMFAIASMANIKVTDVLSSVRTTEGVLRRDFKEQGIVFVKDRKLDQNATGYGLAPDAFGQPDTFGQSNSDYMEVGKKTPNAFDELMLPKDFAMDNDNLFQMLVNENVSNTEEQTIVEGGEISIKGGWVKHPVKGMVPWTVVFDFASLYPTSMRQFNIASESYKGITYDRKTCEFNGVVSNIEPDDIILLNGTVFRNEESVSKKKIETIFRDRKMYKNKMFEVRDKRIELEKQLAALM